MPLIQEDIEKVKTESEMDWYQKILDVFAKSNTYIGALFLSSTAVLIAPESTLKLAYLDEIVANNRPIIAVCGLLSAATLMTRAIQWGWGAIQQAFLEYRRRSRVCGCLKKLSRDEKLVLRPYISHGIKGVRFPCGHAAAMGLVAKGILYRPSGMVYLEDEGQMVDFNMVDDVWIFLNKRLSLLK